MCSNIRIGSVVEIVNPGDWKILKGTLLTVEKVFRWGIKGKYFEGPQLKTYYPHWEEIRLKEEKEDNTLWLIL